MASDPGIGRLAGDGVVGPRTSKALYRLRLSGRRPTGTTFLVKLGGQGLNDVDRAIVTGGVTAKVNTYFPKLGPQEMTLLREQLNELRRD